MSQGLYLLVSCIYYHELACGASSPGSNTWHFWFQRLEISCHPSNFAKWNIQWSIWTLFQEMDCDSGIFILGVFSIFCPFAVKATSTALIFIECFTFHRTIILDNVLCTQSLSWLHSEIHQIWSFIDFEITCLKELLVTLERYCEYVGDQKLCVAVDVPVNPGVVSCPVKIVS